MFMFMFVRMCHGIDLLIWGSSAGWWRMQSSTKNITLLMMSTIHSTRPWFARMAVISQPLSSQKFAIRLNFYPKHMVNRVSGGACKIQKSIL